MKKSAFLGFGNVKMTKGRVIKNMLKNSKIKEKEGEKAWFKTAKKRQVSFGQKYFGHFL